MLFRELFEFFTGNILSIFVLTIFNYLYSIEFIGSSTVFIIRESVLLLFLYILHYYRVEFGIISKEGKYIETVVYRKAPVLRYYWLFGFFSIFTTIGLSVIDFPEGQPFYIEILFNLAVFLWFIFLVLSLLRLSILFKSPELSDFFNVRKSIRHHGLRSFSTATKLLHNWKQAGPVIVIGAFSFDIVGTKFFNGSLGTRSITENLGSRHLGVHKVMARNNLIYEAATHFLDHYPEKVDSITDKNGYVNGRKLAEAYAGQDGPIRVNVPNDAFIIVEFKHNVNISLGSPGSSSSKWPKWFKK